MLHLHGLEDEDDVAGRDVLAVGDGDLDDRAGHRGEQAAARDGVGRVGEARDLAQADGPTGPVDPDLPRAGDRAGGDQSVGPHGDAVDLEPDVRG